MSDISSIPIKLGISFTDLGAGLGVRVYLDGVVAHENANVTEPYTFEHSAPDDDGEHELAIELFGKLPEHTQLNESGYMVKDTLLQIKSIEVDDIDVMEVFTKIGEYAHDFNGTQAPTTVKFWGDMGCNGTAKFKFKTPFYLWLLEAM